MLVSVDQGTFPLTGFPQKSHHAMSIADGNPNDVIPYKKTFGMYRDWSQIEFCGKTAQFERDGSLETASRHRYFNSVHLKNNNVDICQLTELPEHSQLDDVHRTWGYAQADFTPLKTRRCSGGMAVPAQVDAYNNNI